MDREPDDLEVSILALFGREPLNRHGARRIQDILSQIPVGSVSYDQLAAILSDMIHAGWLVGRILPGPGGVAADIVDIDITRQGAELLGGNEEVTVATQVAPPAASAQAASGVELRAPKCFISYSYDTPEHEEWVLMLACELRRNGIDARLDKWGTRSGAHLPMFMEDAIAGSDYVLIICTPNYARRAKNGAGGVGYEHHIITGEIFSGSADPAKFIPILRSGDQTGAIPTYFHGKKYIDFTDDSAFSLRFTDLLRDLLGRPLHPQPALGFPPALDAEPDPVPPPPAARPTPNSDSASAHVLEGADRTMPAVPQPAAQRLAFGIAQPPEKSLDLARELSRAIGEVPLYAIWARPVGNDDTFPSSQNEAVENLLHTRQTKHGRGEMLFAVTSHATIVQEGVAASSESARYVLLDSGFMCYATALSNSQWQGISYPHTIDPITLVGDVVSFLRLYAAIWRTNHSRENSFLPLPQSYGTQLCLSNVEGWELRPGMPGTAGYGHLYDIDARDKGLRSTEILALLDGPRDFEFRDHPDLSALTLLQSLYSAFGYRVEDIPFLNWETLTFDL